MLVVVLVMAGILFSVRGVSLDNSGRTPEYRSLSVEDLKAGERVLQVGVTVIVAALYSIHTLDSFVLSGDACEHPC